MPSVPIHPPSHPRETGVADSTLPQVLRTPSGLAIVEVQGTMRSNLSPSLRDTAEAPPIGQLVFPYYDETKGPEDTSWHKRVHMYVGKHQRLTGEVKKLANPIAVLRRRTSADDRDELEIAEIVYYKLLFAHRPEPVGGGDQE